MHCPCKLRKKKKKQSKTPKPNKLFTLSALARHFFSHSHLFRFTQLETREKASNIQPLCSLGVGALKRPEFKNGLNCRYGFLNALANYTDIGNTRFTTKEITNCITR